MDYQIQNVHGRQVYDSRGMPTVEVDITLQNSVVGTGLVPSGASTGQFEVLELRDGGQALGGKGVMQAVGHVNDIIAPALIGMDVRDFRAIDNKLIALDGTPDKSKLGANAILGVSMAAVWAGANAQGVPLYAYLSEGKADVIPTPMVQMIGGGAHAGFATDIQDYLIIPLKGDSFAQAYAGVAEVYYAVQALFKEQGKPGSVADEGGLWPSGFATNADALELIVQAIERAGYRPGEDMAIALDIASSEFYDEATGNYTLQLENATRTRDEFLGYLCKLAIEYPIISIEDGMAETDWEGSKELTQRLGNSVQLIGDDLFTTNISRIRTGVEKSICNSVLVKMNQIGTVSETLDTIAFTQQHGYNPVVSARSGETEDVTIVHLAIATNAGQIKVGSCTRSERTAKWNELIRIEERTQGKLHYAGAAPFARYL